MASDFEFISKDKESKIYQDLQTGVIYLGSQSGNIGSSFKVDNYTISWDGNSTLFNAYLNGSKISIASQFSSNDFLASNFDSSQTFFEVLEQRDKLEKENQELKTKQAYNAYGIPQNTFTKSDSTDSIIQTLLKESKENKKNQGE
ncbi:hypothetical protein [Helicobacter ganmani]|uniref:hypothetical protein n=2 Tax=Helicobacter TaxID=209 RepID=UPI003A86B6AB